MKVMVATVFLTLLIVVGWDRSYDEQIAAFSAANYGELLSKLKPQPPPESVAAIPMPPAPPEPATDTPLPPVAPPPDSSAKSSSWMWGKSALDNPHQSGVDRNGVHTFEPMLRNNQ